jgi:hypothetical protein
MLVRQQLKAVIHGSNGAQKVMTQARAKQAGKFDFRVGH